MPEADVVYGLVTAVTAVMVFDIDALGVINLRYGRAERAGNRKNPAILFCIWF